MAAKSTQVHVAVHTGAQTLPVSGSTTLARKHCKRKYNIHMYGPN